MAGRDLTFGVVFRRRGMAAAARGVRAVSGAVRSTGAAGRSAVGGVAALGRSLSASVRHVRDWGEAHRRAARQVRTAERATDAARRSAARYDQTMRRASSLSGMAWRGAGVVGGSLVGGRAVARVMAVGAQATRLSIRTNAELTRLMTDARASEADISGLFREMTGAAQRHGVSYAGIVEGVKRVVSDTGDYEFAAQSVGAIARGMQAFGASGADLGTLAAKMRGLGDGGVDPLRGIDILGAIGMRGSVPLPALAGVASELFGGVAQMGGWGGNGENVMTQLGAMVQAAADVTGGAEGVDKAVTALSAFVQYFLKPENRKRLEKAGISAYEDGRLRMPMAVAEDIRAFVAGDNRRLGDIFPDVEAMKGVLGLMNDKAWWRAQREYMVDYPTARRDADRGLEKNVATTAAQIERLGASAVAVSKRLDDFVNPVTKTAADLAVSASEHMTLDTLKTALVPAGIGGGAGLLAGGIAGAKMGAALGVAGGPLGILLGGVVGGALGAVITGVSGALLAGLPATLMDVLMTASLKRRHVPLNTAALSTDTLTLSQAAGLAKTAPLLAGTVARIGDTGALDMLAPPPPAAIRAAATPPAPPARPATSAAGVDIPPEVLAAIPPGGHVVIHRGGDIGEMNFTINAPTAEAEDIADAVRGSAEELLAVVDRERGAATAQHD